MESGKAGTVGLGSFRTAMKACKDVAWNSVHFQCPSEWQVDQIGKRHLRLGNGRGPVMEVKWGPVKGRFSHNAHLKRLAALNARRAKGRVVPWTLPDSWKAALADFETGGFQWQTTTAEGRGVSLYCPVCHNGSLIQFFRSTPDAAEKEFLAVLNSFRDHPDDGRIVWSVFDIRAKLPQILQLRRFRFDAGRFELEFTDGRQTIHLHRWAPAAALLGKGNLTRFAGTISEFSSGQPIVTTVNGHPGIQWSMGPPAGRPQWIVRLKPQLSFFWFRMWLLEEKNRIFGVRAASRHYLDEDQLNRICMDYETV